MPSSFLYRRALLALLPVLLGISATAQNWASSARELAEQIVAHAQTRSAMTVSVRNLSSLTPNDVAQVRRAVEAELRLRGVQLVSPERAVDEARLTLSENAEGQLWVAEVGHGDSWGVMMVRAEAIEPAGRGGSGVSIRKRLVWTQAQPMLDIATADLPGGTVLVVLQADWIMLYRLEKGAWARDTATPVTHSQPFARDARGRVMLQRDGGFLAYLPGVQCSGTTQPHLAARCEESDDSWPLGADAGGLRAIFNPSRNYFTGVLVPGLGVTTKLPPFYSAATFQEHGTARWLFALVDGSTRLVSATGENLGAMAGSGSDLAEVRSECGEDSLVLTSRAADRTRPDAVQAYEMKNGEPAEAGPSAEFAGPLLALWSSQESHAATAVSRNLKTRQYEAFTLTLACGR